MALLPGVSDIEGFDASLVDSRWIYLRGVGRDRFTRADDARGCVFVDCGMVFFKQFRTVSYLASAAPTPWPANNKLAAKPCD